MDFLLVLAQQVPKAAGSKRWLERAFDQYPPEVAIPAFIVGLIVLAWLLEQVVIRLVRRSGESS